MSSQDYCSILLTWDGMIIKRASTRDYVDVYSYYISGNVLLINELRKIKVHLMFQS